MAWFSIENLYDPKNTTKKLLESITHSNKVVGHKINTKVFACVYINNKLKEKKIMKTMPFTIERFLPYYKLLNIMAAVQRGRRSKQKWHLPWWPLLPSSPAALMTPSSFLSHMQQENSNCSSWVMDSTPSTALGQRSHNLQPPLYPAEEKAPSPWVVHASPCP